MKYFLTLPLQCLLIFLSTSTSFYSSKLLPNSTFPWSSLIELTISFSIFYFRMLQSPLWKLESREYILFIYIFKHISYKICFKSPGLAVANIINYSFHQQIYATFPDSSWHQQPFTKFISAILLLFCKAKFGPSFLTTSWLSLSNMIVIIHL